MGNHTGTNLWLMGWLFFIGYNLSQPVVKLDWYEYIFSIAIWPMQLAHHLVANGVL